MGSLISKEESDTTVEVEDSATPLMTDLNPAKLPMDTSHVTTMEVRFTKTSGWGSSGPYVGFSLTHGFGLERYWVNIDEPQEYSLNDWRQYSESLREKGGISLAMRGGVTLSSERVSDILRATFTAGSSVTFITISIPTLPFATLLDTALNQAASRGLWEIIPKKIPNQSQIPKKKRTSRQCSKSGKRVVMREFI